MPTASKLIAAVAFGLVAYLAALAYVPLLPDGTTTGYFAEIMAGLGLVIGWQTMGAQIGRGYAEAASLGLRTSLFIVVWALLGFAVYAMILRSTKMIYHNAGEAMLDVPIQMMTYGKLLGDVRLIETLIVGGVIGGLVTEYAGRRWS